MRADVLILGAGPAGVSTALGLLCQGISVAIVSSKGRVPGIPVDVLSPETKTEFAHLGIQAEAWSSLGVACHGIDAAWGNASPTSYSFLRNPYGDGIAVPRSTLHPVLLQCATDAGAHHSIARFVGAEPTSTGWRVTSQAGEINEQIECRVLVDASGRASVVSRHMGARFRRFDSLCSVGALLDGCKTDRILSVTATQHGWWYSAPTPDGRTLVSFLSDADVLRRLSATRPDVWLSLLRPVRRALSLGDLPRRPALEAYPCESSTLEAMGTAWLAVGDAAARFDPLSATGVLHAIRSGRTAAAAVASYLGGNSEALNDFARGELDSFAAYLRGRRSQYGLERRFSQHAFWARRTADGRRFRESEKTKKDKSMQQLGKD